ncbi:uncharacterized protein MELLADRAFT_50494 [Melampsora larici-populina 98AG31]|uniref:Matrin-type domain-containing protein n=1 Tax=Melampsora larici-populina (strain 98AG31 / pathotype 3-4-7) TaxID=747676 RepID=F4S5B0_MELLP|nr:uncharacterized protein MELLADRAFT_50494 [Melampsora larici-populina 98AG31]EGG00135.1 hypothetical protein MELLADRAFT_50494 [Melampsora larici-populina 98AG31]
MSFSLLEDVRGTHQDLDRLMSHLTSLLLPGTPKVHRDQLVQAHRASYLSELITERANSLVEVYADPDGEHSTEIERLSTAGGELTEFYARLGRLNEYHNKYPNRMVEEPEIDWGALGGVDIEGRDFVDRMFTGEEMLGRYLDLHIHHDAYNNLTPSANKRLAYIAYIDSFDKFDILPRSTKSKNEYDIYLRELREYLVSFHKRIRPMQDLDADLVAVSTEFETKWAAGEIQGWEDPTTTTAGTSAEASAIWCAACSKHYSKETVYNAHLQSKKHIRAAERLTSSTSFTNITATTSSTNGNINEIRRAKDHALALLEQEIAMLGTKLTSIRVDTKANVERRAALTDKERQQEIEEQAAREAAERGEAERAAREGEQGAQGLEEDDDEARIYNPLKLPLGWDGKPIPYWLYKLHGLGVEYKCEICSDFIYMGRKNFERHFQESRHAFGMRALGLPNTKHFHEITRIEDAFALAEKLKSEGRAEIFRDETMEELEDDDGNVYNRKTYEDLKRQGLL